MALINVKKSAIFVAPDSATLPVAPIGFVETSEPVLVVPEFTSTEVNRLGGALNSSDTIVDVCAAKTSFAAECVMRSNNVAQDALSTPPEFGVLLKAAGFIETTDDTVPDGETVTYTNGTAKMPQNSMLVYMDDKKFEFTGSLSSAMTMTLEVGQAAMISSDFFGYMDDPEPQDETNPVVTKTEEPPLVVSCADIFLFDGTSLPLTSVTIGMNPVTKDVYTIGGIDGIKSEFITDYALDIQAVFYVDKDTYGREAANIKSAEIKTIKISLGLDAASAPINGKSVVLTADLSKTTVYSDEADDDLLRRTVTYRLMDGASAALSILMGAITPPVP